MAVLFERFVLIGCSLANEEREPVAWNGEGRPTRYRVVPRAYAFHTPCPFGKDVPDSGCRFCTLHKEQHLLQRGVTEGEADALHESDPGAWETVAPTPIGR